MKLLPLLLISLLLAVPVYAQAFTTSTIITSLVNAILIFIKLAIIGEIFEKIAELGSVRKNKVFLIVYIAASLLLGWYVATQYGYLWQYFATTNLFHFKVWVNIAITAAVFYFLVTLLWKEKFAEKTAKASLFFLVLLIGISIASHMPGYKPYNSNEYKYIWQRPFVEQGKIYLFGEGESDNYGRYYSKNAWDTLGGKTETTDGETKNDRRYGIFTGRALWALLGMLFFWYFVLTKVAGLAEKGETQNLWAVWIFTILISTKLASKGMNISTVIACIQIAFFLIIRDGFKEKNGAGMATAYALIFMIFVSNLILPEGVGFFDAIWENTFYNDTEEAGFWGVTWKIIAWGVPLILILFFMLGKGFGWMKKGDENEKLNSLIGRWGKKLWNLVKTSMYRGLGSKIPGIRGILHRDFNKTDALEGEEHPVYEEIRVEMEALNAYMTRFEMYTTKQKDARILVTEMSKQQANIRQQWTPAKSEHDFVSATYGSNIIEGTPITIGTQTFTTYQTNNWGVQGVNLQLGTYLIIADSLLSQNLEPQMNNYITQIYDLLKDIDSKKTDAQTCFAEISSQALLDGNFVELLEMFTPPSYYGRSFRYTAPGTRIALYTDPTHETTINQNVEVDSKNRILHDIQEIKNQAFKHEREGRKFNWQEQANTIRISLDPKNTFIAPMQDISQVLEHGWDEYLNDLRWGEHHPNSVTADDYIAALNRTPPLYAKFVKKQPHIFRRTVQQTNKPGRGTPAFDNEALNNPGHWEHFGVSTQGISKEQNIYPTLSTMGLTKYIQKRVQDLVKTEEEMWKSLEQYARDIGEEPPLMRGSWKRSENTAVQQPQRQEHHGQ